MTEDKDNPYNIKVGDWVKDKDGSWFGKVESIPANNNYWYFPTTNVRGTFIYFQKGMGNRTFSSVRLSEIRPFTPKERHIVKFFECTTLAKIEGT